MFSFSSSTYACVIRFNGAKTGGWYETISWASIEIASFITTSVRSLVSSIVLICLEMYSFQINKLQWLIYWYNFANRWVWGSIRRPTLSHFSAKESGAKSFSFLITSFKGSPFKPEDIVVVVLRNPVNLASNLRLWPSNIVITIFYFWWKWRCGEGDRRQPYWRSKIRGDPTRLTKVGLLVKPYWDILCARERGQGLYLLYLCYLLGFSFRPTASVNVK